MTPGRARVASVALALAAPLLFWGCIEAGTRLAGVSPLSEDESYVKASAQRRCQFGWRAADGACAAKHFAHSKHRLLVALGGSSVFGYPPGNESFAPKLAELLKGVAPKTWRVVNRGFPCKTSYFVRSCAEHALEAGAELLVIYAGHNDFANYGAWSPERRIWLEQNAWLYDLEVWLVQSSAFSLVVDWMRGDTKPEVFPKQPDEEQLAAAREVVREAYERNIEAVIEAAAEREVRVILSTVASNLYEYPVARSDWDSSPLYDPEERPDLISWSGFYREGIVQHRAGNSEAALSAFSAARDHYLRGRAPAMLNESIRELAATHSNVELVDAEALIHAKSREGIGCNFFGSDDYCDQFHPNSRTQQMIAEAVIRKMREMGLVPDRSRRKR